MILSFTCLIGSSDGSLTESKMSLTASVVAPVTSIEVDFTLSRSFSITRLRMVAAILSSELLMLVSSMEGSETLAPRPMTPTNNFGFSIINSSMSISFSDSRSIKDKKMVGASHEQPK